MANQSRGAPRPTRPREGILSGRSGIRTGAGPAVVATGDTARTAEHVASHRERRYPRKGGAARQARRRVARPDSAKPAEYRGIWTAFATCVLHADERPQFRPAIETQRNDLVGDNLP